MARRARVAGRGLGTVADQRELPTSDRAGRRNQVGEQRLRRRVRLVLDLACAVRPAADEVEVVDAGPVDQPVAHHLALVALAGLQRIVTGAAVHRVQPVDSRLQPVHVDTRCNRGIERRIADALLDVEQVVARAAEESVMLETTPDRIGAVATEHVVVAFAGVYYIYTRIGIDRV